MKANQRRDDEVLTIREHEASMAEIRRAVDLALNTGGSTVELREYLEKLVEDQRGLFDAMFSEGQRATEIAERERAKAADALFAESRRASEMAERERSNAASALREEQRRAVEMAERERSKAADALATSLAGSIAEGDERLREHISNQVLQINAAMQSSEKLQLARQGALEEAISALRREMVLIQSGQEQAVMKAEDAQKEVNVRSNEFRGQLGDQAAQLMPRKETEALMKELRILLDKQEDRLTLTNSRIDTSGGEASGARRLRVDTREDLNTRYAGIYLLLATAAIAVSYLVAHALHLH